MSECPQCTSMCIYETRDMECNHNGGHSSCAWPTPQYECGTNGVSPDATCHAHMCPLTYSYTPVVHLDLCLCVCTAHSLCAHTGMISASRRCDALSRAAGDGLCGSAALQEAVAVALSAAALSSGSTPKSVVGLGRPLAPCCARELVLPFFPHLQHATRCMSRCYAC